MPNNFSSVQNNHITHFSYTLQAQSLDDQLIGMASVIFSAWLRILKEKKNWNDEGNGNVFG